MWELAKIYGEDNFFHKNSTSTVQSRDASSSSSKHSLLWLSPILYSI